MAKAVRVDTTWLEWTVCAAVAIAAAIGSREKGWWFVMGWLVLLAAAGLGTARWFFLPAAAGKLAIIIPPLRRWEAASLAVVCGGAAASALLCWLFPIPESPPLSGPFAVGTEAFELAAVGKFPALVAQVWYPGIASKDAPRAPWLPDPELAPRFPFHRIGKARSRSQAGLELSATATRLPVVFYEHSWTGHRAENVVQAEELASRGFVVVAVDHPGQAARVKLRDGTVIVSTLPASLDLSTEQAVEEFEKLAEKCLKERIEDLGRVKQALASGEVLRFSNRLELDRTGVFGFSFGGTCALRLCARDPSFFAGANEDGFFLGNDFPRGPFLFFDQQMPEWLLKPASPGEGAGEALTRRCEERILKALEIPGRSRVILDGTRHESFSDRIFICRIPRLAHVGSRPAVEIHRIITSQLGDFFKRELQ